YRKLPKTASLPVTCHPASHTVSTALQRLLFVKERVFGSYVREKAKTSRRNAHSEVWLFPKILDETYFMKKPNIVRHLVIRRITSSSSELLIKNRKIRVCLTRCALGR